VERVDLWVFVKAVKITGPYLYRSVNSSIGNVYIGQSTTSAICFHAVLEMRHVVHYQSSYMRVPLWCC
jgi:hypothetical protein